MAKGRSETVFSRPCMSHNTRVYYITPARAIKHRVIRSAFRNFSQVSSSNRDARVPLIVDPGPFVPRVSFPRRGDLPPTAETLLYLGESITISVSFITGRFRSIILLILHLASHLSKIVVITCYG